MNISILYFFVFLFELSRAFKLISSKYHLKINSNGIAATTKENPQNVRKISNWEQTAKLYRLIQYETIISFMPKEELIILMREIRENPVLMSKIYSRFSHFWIYFQGSINSEERNLQEIFGKDICDRLLDLVEKLDFYESEIMRQFMTTPAFGNIIGGLVCDVANDLTSKTTIIEKIVSNTPVVGPLRKRINKTLDKTVINRFSNIIKLNVGPLFSKRSMPVVIKYVVSKREKISMKKLNRNIIESLFVRKLSNFFLEDHKSVCRMKEAIWALIQDTPMENVIPLIDFIYDHYGEKRLADIIEINSENIKMLINENEEVLKVTEKVIHSIDNETYVNIIIKLID